HASATNVNPSSPSTLLRCQLRPLSNEVNTATVNHASGRVKAIAEAIKCLGSVGSAAIHGSTCGRPGMSPLTKILSSTIICWDSGCAAADEAAIISNIGKICCCSFLISNYLLRYFSGSGLSGPSPCQNTVTIHQRLP